MAVIKPFDSNNKMDTNITQYLNGTSLYGNSTRGKLFVLLLLFLYFPDFFKIKVNTV